MTLAMLQQFKKSFYQLFQVTIAAGMIGLTGQAANAGQLYNGWNYAIDSFSDGSGGEAYNIRGLALKEEGGQVFVALNGGTPLTGVSNAAAADGNIGWGDLFFNFSGTNFQAAQGNVFGIRFAGTNDSGAASTGVYQGVRAKSGTSENHGYNSLRQYYNYGYAKTNTLGTDLPTTQAAYAYLYPTNVANSPTTGNTPILTAINTGTKVGNINMLSRNALTGLDFGHFGARGSQTFGFSFDRSLLPDGNFLAHVFLECGNDGVALAGTLQEVPELTGLLGLTMVGLLGSVGWLRRKAS
jgi:hypothetical protein